MKMRIKFIKILREFLDNIEVWNGFLNMALKRES